ncbi:MAG: aspartate aminotransferase family protein [Desulfurococcales archaeon]|nr:aspartate aminotransferase family protein [Desulfurococcales archaeon]
MKESYYKGLSPEHLFSLIEKVESRDMDPWTGKVFTHIYDPGEPELIEYARGALLRNYDKTMLDFTVYPSIVFYETDLARFLLGIFKGGENSVGSFTYGGTESIMLAAKSAREYFKKKAGDATPEIVLPETAHPAFRKSAEYLGMRTNIVRANRETWTVDPADIDSAIGKNTAMVVVSTPNYPYGTVDPVEEVASTTRDKDVWLHVDACLGGMILPFLREKDPEIPRVGFDVEGVYSISVDMHKFGYAPKGSSMILYRDKHLRLGQLYVNASWPGYPLVNQAVLSTRSAGTLAAAWTIARLLGYEGYSRMAEKIYKARRTIEEGINNTGSLYVIGKPKAGTLAFTSDKKNIFHLGRLLKKKGWILQSQPGNRHLGYPPSLHMTISPVHAEGPADKFVEDLAMLVDEAEEWNWQLVESIIQQLGLGQGHDREAAALMGRMVKEQLVSGGGEGEGLDLVNLLIYWLEPDKVEELLKIAVNEIFS